MESAVQHQEAQSELAEEQKDEVSSPDAKRFKVSETEESRVAGAGEQQETEQKDQQQLYITKLKLTSFAPLDEMGEGRNTCPQCKQSRKFFCYDCYLPLADQSRVPKLELPIQVTVLRHPKEKISKSSIVPAKVICPDHVKIRHDLHIEPLLKEGETFDEVVLLFPAEDAKDVQSMSHEELLAIKHLVIIDSTWHQTKHFLREPNVVSLKKVKIQTEKTAFWRYQRIAETNLSTIEAMYFFFRDFETNLNCGGDLSKYSGKWDDLLYYYAYNYWLIQKAYTEGNRRYEDFTRIKGYITGLPDTMK
ncbi:hypothetical protein FGO68_gene11452 [Halteria grandinella]|uniref:tRNA-uridine aminocarboxypropyltransferase 1 n=1 Tax=Halteria grandinella TaxID=5974 RepID=A0A8J8NKY5_HALGN|nr:hypothetical protein FGO68_gene11452 [Halteria grandinella]